MNAAGGRFSGGINASNIYGGIIDGAAIFSKSASGDVTSISGGLVALNSSSQFTSMLSLSTVNGTYKLMVQPYCVKATNTTGYESYIAADGIHLLDPNDKVTTINASQFHTPFINADKGTVGSVDDSELSSIVNVQWAKNKIPTSTRGISADYVPSIGGYGGGGQLIKFKNADSGLLTAATAQYVQNYVQNYVGANVNTSNFVTSSQLSGYMHSLHQTTTGGNAVTNLSYSGGTLRFAKGKTFKVASSSDKRLKYDFSDINNVEKFYMLLNPQNYRFKTSDTDDKVHTGLIAQELIESLTTCGLDYKDYNIIEEYEPRDFTDEGKYSNGEKLYRINYENLHGYHIAFAQDLYKEIESLKQEIKELKETINK